jgi:hypothetical protein
MADELHDLKAVNGSKPIGQSSDPTEAARLAKLAARAEGIATELERP